MAINNITSLTIGSLNFDGTNFILQEVKGLEFPLVRLPRYNLPGQSGAFVSNALYGERSIKIKGVVNAPDGKRSTYVNNRTTLINAVSFIRSVANVLQSQTMTITLANGQIVTTQVYVDTPLQMAYSADASDWEEFLLTFIAPDPSLYSSLQTVSNLNLPVGGGTAIPTKIPISLASSSGGQLTINNVGSNFALPIITLTPPLTNPFIANLTTNQFIKLNMTLVVGQQNIIIDCNAQTITQGGTDVSNNKTLDSIYWSLAPGNNSIGFSATAGSGTAQVAFYPSFVGV